MSKYILLVSLVLMNVELLHRKVINTPELLLLLLLLLILFLFEYNAEIRIMTLTLYYCRHRYQSLC